MSLGLPQKNGVGSMEPGIEDYNGLYIWDVIPNNEHVFGGEKFHFQPPKEPLV